MNEIFQLDRRDLLKAGGFLTLSFALPSIAFGQDGVKLPGDLKNNPNLSSWISIAADNTVTLKVGKVELGQGAVTAVAQICADELMVDFDELNVVSGDTWDGPDEGTTAGSQSMPNCAPAVQQAAAEVREILIGLAAQKLGQDAGSLKIANGRITAPDGQSVSYGEIITGEALNVEASGKAKLIPASEHRYIGQSVPRLDIPAKMTGEPIFVQEMHPDGVVYGAVARPPTYRSKLVNADLAAIEAMPGVIKAVRNGSFLGVVAEHQDQAWAAAEALERDAEWQVESVLPTHEGIYDWLQSTESIETEIVNNARSGGGEPANVLERTYYRPYHMHGSIGTSAAIAGLDGDGVMTIHTHSQSVFATAAAIAELLGMEEGKVRCIHAHGSGCYGHNLADDAAADAALLANAVPGRPVKLQYTRAQEHKWEPYGSAMVMTARAGVDGEGNVLDWNMEIWSTPHSTRPGGKAGRLLSGRYVDPPFELPTPEDGGPPAYAAARNGIPLYEFPGTRVATHFVTDMPLRVSATRGLGAFANVFAIESFLDELASAAGADPVEYRLRFLKNERARDVLVKCAETFGWDSFERASNRGRGIAFAQYKNLGAYTAVAVEVEVTPRNGRVRVIRAASANDSGHMINPDGITNQIEGGIIQSISWTLKEEVRFDDTQVLSSDWASYPILTFSEVPPVEVALIDRPGQPYLGTGEASQGPAGAAVANAVFDAVGARVDRVPLTPERVKQAMDRA
jgi:CO/xanthine dehydrogenase Mo-binding subunit